MDGDDLSGGFEWRVTGMRVAPERAVVRVQAREGGQAGEQVLCRRGRRVAVAMKAHDVTE